MFCYKCGAQLPEDAIFCMKCGAKVPTIAGNDVPVTDTIIPESTNPISTLTSNTPEIDTLEETEGIDYLEKLLNKKDWEIRQNLVGDLYSFQINGKEYKYDIFNEKAFSLFNKIARYACVRQDLFCNMYESSVNNIVDMWEKAVPFLSEEISLGYKYAMTLLAEYGIYCFDEDELYVFIENQGANNEDENCNCIKSSLLRFVNRVEYLTDKAEEDAEHREARRKNESHMSLVGGGFGLTGALMGMITAGALNLAGDAIRGTSNIIEDSLSNNKIRNKLIELYAEGRIYCLFYKSIEQFYLHDIFTKVAMILADKRILTWAPYKKGSGLKRIAIYPFCVEDYSIAYSKLTNLEDKKKLLEVTKYFGFDSIYLRYISVYDKTLIEETLNNAELSNEEKLKRIEEIGQADPAINVTSFTLPLMKKINEENKAKEERERLEKIDTEAKELADGDNIKAVEAAQFSEKVKMADAGNQYAAYVVIKAIRKIIARQASVLSEGASLHEARNYQKSSSITERFGGLMGEAFVCMHNQSECVKKIYSLSQQGYPHAMFRIGLWGCKQAFPDEISVSVEEGLDLLKKAAEMHVPEAVEELGKAYIEGLYGLSIDKTKGETLLTEAKLYGLYSAEKALNKSRGQSDGCYITTAVCRFQGKPDDCYELTMFRSFRDNWLINTADGEELIKKYYKTAPQIVEIIDSSNNSEKEYRHIWDCYLSKCLRFLESGCYAECKAKYVEMVEDLSQRFHK